MYSHADAGGAAEARALKRMAEVQGLHIEAAGSDLMNMRMELEARHAREGAILKILQMTEDEARKRKQLEETMADRVTMEQLQTALTVLSLPPHVTEGILNKVAAHVNYNSKLQPQSQPQSQSPTTVQTLIEGNLPATPTAYRDLLMSM